MGWVSLTTLAKERKIAAAQTASTALPGTVVIKVAYQSLLRKNSSGIFSTTSAAMEMNSLRGANTRFSSSPLMMRISESFPTMGLRVLFMLWSYWQAESASHHSRHTSLSIADFSSANAAFISGSMCLMRVRKPRNTPCTGGFR